MRAFEYDKVISDDFRDIERAQRQVYRRISNFKIEEVLHVFETMNDLKGKAVPGDRQPMFWEIIERNFGPYEEIKQLAG